MGGTLDVVKGVSRDFARQARAADGTLFGPDPPATPSPFLGTDTLTAKVWPGGDLAPAFTPTPAWLDPAVGTFTIPLAASDTSPLAPGVYRFQVYVSRAGKTGKLDDGRLRVLQAPGTAAPAAAFTTRSDLLLYAPWLEELQDDGDELAFASEQSRATDRLIDALVSLWRPGGVGPTIGQPGFTASTLFGGCGVAPSYWLRQQLVPLTPGSTPPASMPDRLSTPANLIDPSVSTALLLYPEVKEVCARWAVSYVCAPQTGREGERNYQRLGAAFAAEAGSLFRSRRFEVDLSDPQTGWAGIVIHGGGGSLR